VTGDRVIYDNGGGSNIGGLSNEATYYVPKSAIDFELGAFSSCIGFKINPYDPPRP
jgi:hypothetical protein